MFLGISITNQSIGRDLKSPWKCSRESIKLLGACSLGLVTATTIDAADAS